MKTENGTEISDSGQKNEKVRESAGEEYGKQSDKASENKYGKDKLNGFGDTVIHDGTYTAEASDSEEKKRSESGKISRMSAGKRTVQLPARKKRGVSEQKKVEKPRTHTPAMRRMSGLREDRATRRKRRAGC